MEDNKIFWKNIYPCADYLGNIARVKMDSITFVNVIRYEQPFCTAALGPIPNNEA